MTGEKPKDDKLLKILEDGIRDILANKKTKTGERLKAIEAGAKLLTIRYRLEGSEGVDDANYFGKSG